MRKIYFTFFLIFAFISKAFSQNLEDNVNFLSFSDIHFNPFASCQDGKPCPLIAKLRQADPSDWEKLFLQYDKSEQQYNQDTNYYLLIATLDSIKKLSLGSNARFVLIPGDFLGHDYRNNYKVYANDHSVSGYRSFVKKTFQFLTLAIQNRFPQVDVYPLIGNNDSYLSDYAIEPRGQFFKDITFVWSPLIKNNDNLQMFQKQFPTAGYYALDLQQLGGVKLIALNSVLFSTEARGKGVTDAANRQFQWLHNQLKDAQTKNQSVILAMHIPMAIDIYLNSHTRLFTLMDLWKANYIKRFQEEVTQFSGQIIMILCAHLHTDWLQFLNFRDGVEIPMSTNSSISPIFGNNPGFKFYRYSLKEKQMTDFMGYSWPLKRLTTFLNSKHKLGPSSLSADLTINPVIQGEEHGHSAAK